MNLHPLSEWRFTIYFKDTEGLLLCVSSIKIDKSNSDYLLTAQLSGEIIDPARHELNLDVKAVTLHRIKVEKAPDG